MNIFVVHSGNDVDRVKEEINEPLMETGSNVLVMDGKYIIWKPRAKKKIKEAQIVLVVVGEKSAESENISWEIKRAYDMDKYVVYYMLDEKYAIPEELYKEDQFSKKKKIFAKEVKSVLEINDIVDKYNREDYGLLNDTIESVDTNKLFEQYKLFLKTSEDLVARRQSVNSFYISVNAALISVSGVAMAMGNTLFNKLIISMAMMLAGIVLDISWLKILEAYGVLNGSKMKIINMIERELPAKLYETEWAVMSDKLNKRKYISFTDSEKRIPKIFLSIYSILITSALVVIIYFLTHGMN